MNDSHTNADVNLNNTKDQGMLPLWLPLGQPILVCSTPRKEEEWRSRYRADSLQRAVKIQGSLVNFSVNPRKSHHVSNFPEINRLDPRSFGNRQIETRDRPTRDASPVTRLSAETPAPRLETSLTLKRICFTSVLAEIETASLARPRKQ